jgi:hypothetical protein
MKATSSQGKPFWLMAEGPCIDLFDHRGATDFVGCDFPACGRQAITPLSGAFGERTLHFSFHRLTQ